MNRIAVAKELVKIASSIMDDRTEARIFEIEGRLELRAPVNLKLDRRSVDKLVQLLKHTLDVGEISFTDSQGKEFGTDFTKVSLKISES